MLPVIQLICIMGGTFECAHAIKYNTECVISGAWVLADPHTLCFYIDTLYLHILNNLLCVNVLAMMII